MIDFHCHVDLYPNPMSVIRECDQLRIRTLAVTTTPLAWEQNRSWMEHSTHVRPALGLHPQVVRERAAEIDEFERLLPQARYVGEIGLDASPSHRDSFDVQVRIFTRILRACEAQGEKVLSVHCVRALPLLLDLVETCTTPTRVRVVLHWFSGSAAHARRALELGCFFSVNLRMLPPFSKRSIAATLPIERLLTETDGPFVMHDQRPIRPTDIAGTEAALASVLKMPAAELSNHMHRNLKTLLGSV